MKTSKTKRLISLLLCVLMLTGMLPLNVLAADGENGGDEPIVAEACVGEASIAEEEPTGSTEEVNETQPIEAEPIEESPELFEAPMLLTAGNEETPAPEPAGKVRVSIVNNTYAMNDGAAWDGTLLDEWVEIDTSSTMMSAIVSALTAKGYTQSGADSDYISAIEGLAEFEGGTGSGWMGTLNDWFTNDGFDAFTVKNGKLEDKDEIAVMYTVDSGADLGGTWDNTDTTVKAVAFSAGSLFPAFSKDVTEYTLTVPYGTTGVVVTPTASNKNYQVRTFDGSVTNYATGAYYKRSELVPVSDGSTIKVVCADPAWPSMNSSTAAVVYTFTVDVAEQQTEPDPEITPVEIAVKVNFSNGGAFLKDKNDADIVMRTVTLNTKDAYTLADVLAEAHALYHANGADAFAFADSSHGPMITRFWGDESGNFNYQINGGSVYVGGADTAVKNGDVIDVYLLESEWPDDEAYTAFTSYTAAATDAEAFTVTLQQAGYDENWNVVISPCAGATITVDGAATTAVTDANGQANVKLTAGSHVISAVKTKTVGDATVTAISAPVCVVEVEHVEPAVAVTFNVAPSTVSVSFYKGADAETAVDASAVEEKGVVKVGSYNFHQYVLNVVPGEYSYRGTDGSTVLGGEPFTVTEAATVNLLRANIYYNSTVLNTEGDYTIVLKNGSNTVALGTPYLNANKLYTPTLLIAGVKHEGTVTLAEKWLDDYYTNNNGTFSTNPSKTTGSASNVTLSAIQQYKVITVTAPTEASTTFYKQDANYVVEEVTPDSSTADEEQGTTTFVFKGTAAHSGYQFRSMLNGKVTQAGYLVDGDSVTVTFPDRSPASTAGTLNYDDNGVLLNVPNKDGSLTGKNKLSLGVGETFKLRAFRAPWEIINNTTGNQMIEPDFHYAILSGDGVVSIAPTTECSNSKYPNAKNGNATGNWMNVTALQAGTAVVAVWYDAIDVYNANTLSTYGATDPARYGIFVVTVGGSTNLSWNPVSQDGDWDSEFDTVYYVGDCGQFTFRPATAVSSVTVQNVYGAALGSSVSVLANDDGSYTVPVTTGANVICADGDYMVVRARQISYTVTNKTTGEAVQNGTPAVTAGDQLTISFSKLDIPVPKMSGIYNPGYLGTGKTAYVLDESFTLYSAGTQYDFSVSEKNDLSFKVPSAGEHTLKGFVSLSSMGDPFGNHRNINDDGKPVNTNASEIFGAFGILPEIRFTAAESEEPVFTYDEVTNVKSIQLIVGGTTAYNYYALFNKVANVNDAVNWKSSGWKGLSCTVSSDSYYNDLTLRYWYEGEEPVTVPLTNGVAAVLSEEQFTVNTGKILNLQISVAPADPALGDAKVWNYVVFPGSSNLKYVHPIIKSLSFSDGDKALALSPALSYTNTAYTLDVDDAQTLNISATQLQMYQNATNNKQDNSDTVTVQTYSKGAALGELHTVLPLTEDKYPVGSWTLENLAVAGADELRISVKSYVDDTTRTYVIALQNTAAAEPEEPEAPVADMNGDGEITDADAVALLMHTMFPDLYPISGNCDVNGDGEINDADAIYLLMYTMFPDLYPLN